MIGNGRVPIGLTDSCYTNWYISLWYNDALLRTEKERCSLQSSTGCITADNAYMNTSNGMWYPQDPDDQTLLNYICEKRK